MHANVSSALMYIGHRVGPSTRSIRQLLEAPKWKEGPKILEKKGFKAKKKKVSNESIKIRHIILTKKQNFCYIQLNIDSTKFFFWSKQNQLSQK